MGAKYFGLQGTKLNLAIGIIGSLDFFLFGYDQGVMGGLLGLPSFLTTFPEIDVNSYPADQQTYASTIQGIVVASYNLGCFAGSLLCIAVGNRLGRKKTIFVGSAIMVVGAALQASAFSIPHLVIGRVVTGVGNGMNTSTVPAWQSETSKSHQRGKMVMIEGAMISGGICFSYWIDFGFSWLEPSTVSWRFPIALQIVFALIIAASIMSLPESPRWLVLRGHEAEAMDVLTALNPGEEEYIQQEFSAIKDAVLEASKGSFRDLFTMDENRHFHRVVLAYVVQAFQQISGINLITYYAPYIYQNYIGLEDTVASIMAACNGTEYFIASWLAFWTIERYGRRTLMLVGAAGMSASMAVLAGTASAHSSTTGIGAAVFLFVFNTFFAIGWLGMTWLYPAEIVPLRIRAQATALSTSANWIFNFMVVMITPISFSSIDYQTYIIFAVINAAIFPSVYFFFPETAGRSLEEMDNIFRKCKSVFTVVRIARDEPHRYGKNGELLIDYEHSAEQRNMTGDESSDGEKGRSSMVENRSHPDEGYRAEGGYGSSKMASEASSS